MTASLVSIALGAFRFALLRATYDQISHKLEERWEGPMRAGGGPALQWAGHGAEMLQLTGAIFPQHHGSMRFVQALRMEAERAEPILLIDGLGFYWGEWVILAVQESQRFHMRDGAPRRQTYSIDLQRYDDGGSFGGVFR